MIHLINLQELDERNPSLAITMMSAYYQKLEDDNTLHHAFYDGGVKSFYDFRNFCLDRHSLHYVIYSELYDAPVCHFYLNGFQGLTCMIHFSFASLIHGHSESVAFAKNALDLVFKLRREQQQLPITRTLVGLTPTSNKLAVKFLKAVGFQPLGILDGACYIDRKRRYVPGLLSKLESPYLLEE